MGKKVTLLLSLLIFSYGVYAMSIKQCLFSEMTGVVSFEGKPAADVKLVRMVDLNKEVYDETITDQEGNFHFPAIYRSSILSKVLPMEFVVLQEITAHFQGKEYEIWNSVKRSPAVNTESRGKALIVECNLSQAEAEGIIVDEVAIFSRCNWDVEPDPDRKISPF
jgi:5-hydroxyisourate hydrolase-like protein (transthyretin family)